MGWVFCIYYVRGKLVHGQTTIYNYILDHPYSAGTDEKNEFAIQDVPRGMHTIEVWHEARIDNIHRYPGERGKSSAVMLEHNGE
jgi:hypothetical protein